MTMEFYAETALPKILDHIVSVKDTMSAAQSSRRERSEETAPFRHEMCLGEAFGKFMPA